MPHALDALFRPSSVAIIGASSDANRIGGRPVAFSKRAFQGRIVPVNPKGGELQGLPAYASITDFNPLAAGSVGIVFRHDNETGRTVAPAHKLFDTVSVMPTAEEPTSFADFTISLDAVPTGVKLIELV